MKKGNILILNVASSSGKSSILRIFDLEVDTSGYDAAACARLIKECVLTGAQPRAIQRLLEAAK